MVMYLIDNTRWDHGKNTRRGQASPVCHPLTDWSVHPRYSNKSKQDITYYCALYGPPREYETPRGLWNHGRPPDAAQR